MLALADEITMLHIHRAEGYKLKCNCWLQGDAPEAAPPMLDFTARFLGLAEDMPRLQKDTFLHEGAQVPSSVALSECLPGVLTPARHEQTSVQPAALLRSALPPVQDYKPSPQPQMDARHTTIPEMQVNLNTVLSTSIK